MARYCSRCARKYVCGKMKNWMPVAAHIDYLISEPWPTLFCVAEIPCNPTSLSSAQCRHGWFAVQTMWRAFLPVKCTIFRSSSITVTYSPLLINGGSRTTEVLFLFHSMFTTTASNSQPHPTLSFDSTEQLKFECDSERGACSRRLFQEAVFLCLPLSFCWGVPFKVQFRLRAVEKLESVQVREPCAAFKLTLYPALTIPSPSQCRLCTTASNLCSIATNLREKRGHEYRPIAHASWNRKSCRTAFSFLFARLPMWFALVVFDF